MIKQNIFLVSICIAAISVMMAVSVEGINKDTPKGEKTHDYSVATAMLGFVGLGIILGSRITSDRYLLMVLSAIAVGLVGMTYHTYEMLNDISRDSREYTTTFASFCLSLVALSFTFSFFFVKHYTPTSMLDNK